MGSNMPPVIIDDSNWQKHVDEHAHLTRGHIARDYKRNPFCATPYTKPFDLELTPRSEWSARIKDRKARGQGLRALRRKYNMPSSDQGKTNFCWMHSVVNALRLDMLRANMPVVMLSAASAAAPCKNFQNVGGWSGEALQWLVEHGVCDIDHWPLNQISKSLWTADAQANAKLHCALEFYDLEQCNFDQKMTLLFNDISVSSGYNWWGHAIVAMEPVEIEPGHFGTIEWNSWTDTYGDLGEVTLAESKSTPDDAVALCSSTPSIN